MRPQIFRTWVLNLITTFYGQNMGALNSQYLMIDQFELRPFVWLGELLISMSHKCPIPRRIYRAIKIFHIHILFPGASFFQWERSNKRIFQDGEIDHDLYENCFQNTVSLGILNMLLPIIVLIYIKKMLLPTSKSQHTEPF